MCRTDWDVLLKADDDELKELLRDYPEVERIVTRINGLEKVLARLLRNLGRDYIKVITTFYDEVGGAFNLAWNIGLQGQLAAVLASERLIDDLKAFFPKVSAEMAELIMSRVDKTAAFSYLNPRAVRFLESYSETLAGYIGQNSADKVLDVLTRGVQAGKSIDELTRELKEHDVFSRARARRIAITETLTAYSVGEDEAYRQSPSVIGTRWQHTGARKNKPREAHVAMSGQYRAIGEPFDVNGYPAMYPRDPVLPAKERVNCHCTRIPVVDERIIGLDEDERQAIRDNVLSNFE